MIATFEQIKEMEQELKKDLKTSFTVDSEVIKGIKQIIKGHKKASIEVLNGVLVEVVNNNVIKVTYSDADLTIEKMFLATVKGVNKKSFILPIDIIKGIKYIKKKELFTFVEKNENSFELIRNNSVQEMVIVSGEEYPQFSYEKEEFETVETSTGYEYFDKNDLKFLLKATKSVSDSETRPVLKQVSITNKTIVSTDPHRLYKADTVFSHGKTILVSPQMILKANDLISDNVFMKMEVSDYNVKITDDMTTNVYCRQMEGNFPDTSRLIPNEFKVELKVEEVNELYDFLKNVKNGKNSVVNMKVNFNTHKLELDSMNGTSMIKTELPVIIKNHDSKDFKISFSSKYFMDAIEQMDKETFELKFLSNFRPFIANKVGNNKEFALLLPVRTY